VTSFCEAGERFNILNAIEDGAGRLNLFKAHKLRRMIKRDKQQFAMSGGTEPFYEIHENENVRICEI
jgi:hypothetical protein